MGLGEFRCCFPKNEQRIMVSYHFLWVFELSTHTVKYYYYYYTWCRTSYSDYCYYCSTTCVPLSMRRSMRVNVFMFIEESGEFFSFQWSIKWIYGWIYIYSFCLPSLVGIVWVYIYLVYTIAFSVSAMQQQQLYIAHLLSAKSQTWHVEE